jgi:hypothetical protein
VKTRAREARVLVLLAVVVALNVLDVHLTVRALALPQFIEGNLLWRGLSPAGLLAVKYGILLPVAALLLATRRLAITELGCWILAAAYGCVAVSWAVHAMVLLPAAAS